MGVFEQFPYTNFHDLNLDWIIKKVKECLDQVDVNTADMADLKNYVLNYFANLDVQDEINNKLDEMADNGELANIIAEYLNTQALLIYNTKADMVASVTIADGQTVRTLGKNTYNDGLGYIYKIRTIVNTDVVDGVNIVALTNDNTLVAERLESKVTVNVADVGSVSNIMLSTNFDSVKNITAADNIIYVDGNSGDDNNAGTSDAPIKTLDEGFSRTRKGHIEPRFSLAAGQTYSISYNIFNSMAIHIWGNGSGNININFTNTEDIAFYNCHVNIQGTASRHIYINLAGSKIYFDGGSAIFAYCDLVGNYETTFYNCGFRASNIKISALLSWYSNIALLDANNIGWLQAYSSNIFAQKICYDSSIKYSTSRYGVLCYNCQYAITGATTVDTTGSIANNAVLFEMIQCLLFMSAGISLATGSSALYPTGAEFSNSIVTTTSARLATLSNIANSGYTTSNGTVINAA